MINTIYSKYSNERAEKFQIRTDIIKEDGIKYVIKKSCTRDAEKHIQNMYDYYLKEYSVYERSNAALNKCSKENYGLKFEYIEGETLDTILDKYLDNGDYLGLIEVIKKYSIFVRNLSTKDEFKFTEQFKKVFGNINLTKKLEAGKINNIDLVFNNIIISDKWNVIDYEWVFNFYIPTNYIIYRAIRLYIDGLDKRKKLNEMNLFSIVGIESDEISEYEIMEKNFQDYVSGDVVQLYKLYGKTTEANVDVRKVLEEQNKNSFYNMIQVFFDYGGGFSEENSYKIFSLEDQAGEVKVEINIESNVKRVRIDPCNLKSIINISNISGYNGIYYNLPYSTNCVEFNKGYILSTTDDPQIIIEAIREETNKIEVKFAAQLLLNDDIMKSLCDFFDKKENEIKVNKILLNESRELIREKDNDLLNSNRLIQEKENIINLKENIIEEKQNYIDKIESSRGWRFLNVIRKIIRH